MSSILDITAVLLVGGMGTRLRSVLPAAPKPLASVGSRSFLELLVRARGIWLTRSKPRSVMAALGTSLLSTLGSDSR
jgi:CTP:phosphocholine cytidylyltransferase-like protein